MTESTYLKQNQSPTGCRPRTFHPTLDTVVPSLNNRSPLSQGYESTRMGSRVTLKLPKPVSTQYLIVFSTHNNPKYTNSLLSILHHPKTMNPLHCHAVPQDVHFFPRAPMHMVKNLHVGTLKDSQL
jgi:hypothetical protein